MEEGGGSSARKLAVQIRKKENQIGWEVTLDGHHVENSVVGAVYHMDPMHGPLLILSLASYGEIDIDGPSCVAVDAPTHKALVAMGWIPPGAVPI